jgi:methyltransferase (TIGR00027 family)
MIEAQPSRTAWRVAVRRAAHQLLDNPVVLEDTIAIPILGPELAVSLAEDPARFEVGRFAGPLRAFLAVRSRLAEDALAEAFGDGARQYVVLGAGLDTFAYRNPHAELRVFEVDFPATQAWKRERLAEARIDIPANVTFSPVDFATDRLVDVLIASGLSTNEPTFFSWLGVTPYLKPDTVFGTLADIAPLAAGGGGIVFDYLVEPALLNMRQRLALRILGARVAAAGEPFQGFFHPKALVDRMREMGFRDIRDLGQEELNATFLAGRSDDLRVGSTGHILAARA